MINTINGILEAAKGGKTGVIAVAAAHDQPVIEAVVEARKDQGHAVRSGREPRRLRDRRR